MPLLKGRIIDIVVMVCDILDRFHRHSTASRPDTSESIDVLSHAQRILFNKIH